MNYYNKLYFYRLESDNNQIFSYYIGNSKESPYHKNNIIYGLTLIIIIIHLFININ
jgi:hypothetical protein